MTKEITKDKASNNIEQNLPKFTIRQLLEAGVHFGHKTMRRNTKMSKYLFGVRNGISIINLQKTGGLLNESLKVVKQIAKNNGRILFVATKKQASDVIEQTAKKCGQYYVNHRWLGGMLTNWQTISKSIRTLRDIEKQLENNDLGLNKKEKLVLERKRLKLENALGGIKDMGGYPDLVFVIDTHRESLAIAEAKRIGVPVMAILDSNCNPDHVTYHIPGNDDSIKSIKLYCHLLSEAILSGIKENMSAAGVNLENNKKSAKKVENTKKNEEDSEKDKSKADKPKAEKPNSDKEAKVKKAAAPKKAATAKKTAEKKEVSSEAKIVKKAAPKKTADKKEK
ncbi:30S ribosomal protein S2 [Rickettsiales bacterium]|nr:30S ribosomal protein S2 [Rickettsiales bacterium]